MSNFTQQQWAAFAAMSNQPTIQNAQTFQVDSNTFLSGIPSGYVRLTQNAQSAVMPGPSLQSTAAYVPQQQLGYALQPQVDTQVGTGRQYPNAAFNHPYALQQFHQLGSIPQTIPLPHTTLPYGSPFPYLQTFLPPLTSGIGHMQQCANVPSHQQPPLVGGIEQSLRSFEPIKQFGALSIEPARRAKPMITSKTNLYISGLSETDTDDTVRLLVENVVQPKSCKAMISNGVCKGYGFIDCASEEDAETAKNHIIEQAKLTGRKLLVKFAHENEKDVHNVYVRHLPLDFTKEKLEALFQKFGQVTSVKLLENEDRLTGIGFVRYALAEQAEKAIEQLNAAKLVLGNNTAPVMCKLADKANTRRRQAMPTAHAATTLLVQPQLSLNTPPNRQNTSMSTATLPRCAIPFSQPLQQTTPFTPTIPLATQLLSPLGQPPVLIQSIQPAGSPQSRGILSPAVLSNGAAGSNPMMSVPVTTPPGTINTHVPANSTRATPLIGPPPQTPTSVALQLNQNATNITTPYVVPSECNQGASKNAVSAPTRFPVVQPGSNYVQKDTTNSEQPSMNGSQFMPHQMGGNGCNSQIVFLTAPSILANFPTAAAAATSLLPTYICPTLAQPQPLTSADSTDYVNRPPKLSLPSLPSSYDSDATSNDSINKPDPGLQQLSTATVDVKKCNGEATVHEVTTANRSDPLVNVSYVSNDKPAVPSPDSVTDKTETASSEVSAVSATIVPVKNTVVDGLVASNEKPVLDASVLRTSSSSPPHTQPSDGTATITFASAKPTVNSAVDGISSPERLKSDSWGSNSSTASVSRKKNYEASGGALRNRRRQNDIVSLPDGRLNSQLQPRVPNRRKPVFGAPLSSQPSEITSNEDDAIPSDTRSNLSSNCATSGSS